MVTVDELAKLAMKARVESQEKEIKSLKRELSESKREKYDLQRELNVVIEDYKKWKEDAQYEKWKQAAQQERASHETTRKALQKALDKVNSLGVALQNEKAQRTTEKLERTYEKSGKDSLLKEMRTRFETLNEKMEKARQVESAVRKSEFDALKTGLDTVTTLVGESVAADVSVAETNERLEHEVTELGKALGDVLKKVTSDGDEEKVEQPKEGKKKKGSWLKRMFSGSGSTK